MTLLFLLACAPDPKPADSTVPDTRTDTGESDADTDSDADGDTDTDSDTDTETPVSDPDHDHDGDGYTENQGDCDDRYSGINPGAPEACGDRRDQDCSGLADDNCVGMYQSNWGRWTFDVDGVEAVRLGPVWRGWDGTEYCRAVYEMAVSDLPFAPCEGCEYGWTQIPELLWTEGPGCRGLEFYPDPGTVLVDPPFSHDPHYAYDADWSGTFHGYEVTGVGAFLSTYAEGYDWWAETVRGVPRYDWYDYTKGDTRVVGMIWAAGRYEDTGVYWVDPNY